MKNKITLALTITTLLPLFQTVTAKTGGMAMRMGQHTGGRIVVHAVKAKIKARLT